MEGGRLFINVYYNEPYLLCTTIFPRCLTLHHLFGAARFASVTAPLDRHVRGSGARPQQSCACCWEGELDHGINAVFVFGTCRVFNL